MYPEYNGAKKKKKFDKGLIQDLPAKFDVCVYIYYIAIFGENVTRRFED